MKQKCFESGGSDQGSWLRKRPSPSPASAFMFYTTHIWLAVYHPGFPPRRNSSWLAGTWLLPFLLLGQLLMVCSLAYFAVSCSQLWFVILSYRPNPSLIRDLYVPLTTDRNIFLLQTHSENKANKVCKVLRCHRSGRLYKNIQRLGFFQIPHPCLGIALQTSCAKQLPSPTWKHSTTWQTVFRSRASFPGGKSHWQRIFARANRTQTKHQSVQ